MSTETRISLRHVSEYYRIDFQIVMEWAEFGLYPTLPGEDPGIEVQTLETLKQIISLHRALGVNKEGIEVILNLTQRIGGLLGEVEALKTQVEKQNLGWATDRFEDLKRRGLFIEIDD